MSKQPPSSDSETEMTSFERLQEAATRLNRNTEELGAAIKHTEEKLVALNVGVAVWLESSDDLLAEDRDGTSAWQLGFAKNTDQTSWRLMTRKVMVESTRGFNPARSIRQVESPLILVAAPRRVRLEAVDKFDKLFEALAKRAEQFADDIEGKLRKK